MPEMVRFTAWLSASEKEQLTEVADEQGASLNFVVRTILRDWLKNHRSQLSQVTSNGEADDA